MAESNYRVDPETVREIRRALLIGLTAFGEIERLSNAQHICQFGGVHTIDDGLRVIHPTGCADTVSIFASALTDLDMIDGLILEAETDKPEARRAIKVKGPRSLSTDDGAAFARKYLDGLRADPQSVELAGWIYDIKRADQLESFASVLQGVLAKAIGRAEVSHG